MTTMQATIITDKIHADRNVKTARVFDYSLFIVTVILLVTGLIMVGSSSISIADRDYGDPLYYFWRQLAFIGVGFIAAVMVYKMPLKFWQNSGQVLILLSIVLLAVILIPGIGKTVNGSTRWISLGIVSPQISEFVKLFSIIYVADYLVRHNNVIRSRHAGFYKPFGLLLVIVFLLLMEPDYGAAAVLLATTIGMLWLGGARIWQFIFLSLSTVAALILLAVVSPYRLQRLLSFLDPWADPSDGGFQLIQALIAFGRGEWLGVGLGSSVQKLFYLPEAHTDFLFAVIAEELGLLFVIGIIGLFAFLVFKALMLGYRAENQEMPFAGYLAYGIGLWIALQAFINIGVNMGVLPTKGLTLPLMSYGGSSLVVMCMAIAFLMRIYFELHKYDRHGEQ